MTWWWLIGLFLMALLSIIGLCVDTWYQDFKKDKR